MQKTLLIIMLVLMSCTAKAKGFDTDLSLNLNNYYGYTHYTKPSPRIYKNNNFNSSLDVYSRITYNINSDYKASLIGYIMADTAKEIENYNQGIWGEEFFTLFETPMGDISIGQDYNVAYNFSVGAPRIGNYKINNSYLSNFITNPNWYKKDSKMIYKTLNSTYINTDGSSLKINYTTPEYKGIKLGFTYIPQVYAQNGLVAKNSPYKDSSAYVLGANGFWKVLGYEVETSLGYAVFEEIDKELSAGINVYRKGWTIGASYKKTNKDNKYAINQTTLYDGYRNGSAYNIGFSYEIGPFTTGVSYFSSKSDDFDNSDTIISFSNSYQYNKYTALSLTFAHQKSIDSKTTKGNAFILGLELSL